MPANHDIFARVWSAFAEGRLHDLARLLHPEVEWTSEPLGVVFRGVDDLQRWSDAIARAWKSLTVVIDRTEEAGDDTVAAFGTVIAFGHGGEHDVAGELALVTEYADGRLVRGRVFHHHAEARAYVASRRAVAA